MSTEEEKFIEEPINRQYKQKKHLKIYDELKSLGLNIPDDVCSRANCIANSIKFGVTRKKNRKSFLYHCCYQAYLSLNIPVNIDELSQMFGIKKHTKMHRFVTFDSEHIPLLNVVSPKEVALNNAPSIGIHEDAIPSLAQLIDTLIEKEPLLLEDSPYTVAGGLLLYFMKTNGIVEDKNRRIEKFIKRSRQTIETSYNKICRLHNA